MEASISRVTGQPAPLARAHSGPGPAATKWLITSLLVIGPVAAVAAAIPLLWGRFVTARDLALATFFYVVTGHGITVGFHRMFTHRSFRPCRALKIALGVAGSMAIQGSVTAWVANHRCHHIHSDQPEDPHSPHRFGSSPTGRLRGFLHAHVGWLYGVDDAPAERFAPDLLRDRDVVMLSRLFPAFALASLAVPPLIGWALSGTAHGALTAFLWAGLVRMALLHHVTWSINSVCHLTGRRPFRTADRSGNVAALGLVSLGESWHNLHHAFPASARHGVGRWEFDSSARVIRIFEGLGWATRVHWPDQERLQHRRS